MVSVKTADVGLDPREVQRQLVQKNRTLKTVQELGEAKRAAEQEIGKFITEKINQLSNDYGVQVTDLEVLSMVHESSSSGRKCQSRFMLRDVTLTLEL